MQNALSRLLHGRGGWLMVFMGGVAIACCFSSKSFAAPQAPVHVSNLESAETVALESVPDAAIDDQLLEMAATADAIDVLSAEHGLPAVEQLKFAFERAPWRDVINWIADASDLALQYGDLPTGSFTYSDPRSYSSEEAIARINLFLLPQGYSLIRSNQLLSVINLGDPRSMQQLDALAELVTPTELQGRPKHQVVKCMFPLGEVDGDVASEELSVLKLMTEPLVFSKTRQLMITDTVEKLQQVQRVLTAFQPASLQDGMRMQSFALQHVTANDVLLVARPHLGLATGEMIGIDVSLSTDLQGEHIFVTGVEDKVALVESMVEALDRPAASLNVEAGNNELQSHLVTSGNLDMVYDVLKTLLAGQSLRLSADRATNSIVALATPETQRIIADTVAQLQTADADFEVIQLRSSDPYQIITLLEQMLDLPDEFADRDEIPPDTPKIDADPVNRRLFVRAKPHQIEQIKKIVAGLDRAGTVGQHETRVVPMQGPQAVAALETAQRFWRENIPVVVLPATDGGEQPAVIERVPNDDPAPQEGNRQEGNRIATRVRHEPAGHASARQQSAPGIRGDDSQSEDFDLDDREAKRCDVSDEDAQDGDSTRTSEFVGFTTGLRQTLADETISSEDERQSRSSIRAQWTPNGLLLESDDTEALDRFEQHLRTIAGPMRSSASPPTVFYLQFTKPTEALRLLAELLDGGETAKEASAGQLVKGYVSSPGSYLGSIVVSRDGTLTMMSGTITVVADTRLNRLIAQGTAADIERIQAYLRIIDKDASITDIKTYGMSHVIELRHTDANEVATVIRDAFANRIAANTSGGADGGGGRPGQPGNGRDFQRPDDRNRERDDNERGEGERGQAGQGKAAPDLEPKMTVAVHAASNSLIITAPEPLFVEVEQLVQLIDSRSEKTVEVLAPENAAFIQSVLQPNDSSRGGNSSNRNRDRDRGRNTRNPSQNSRVMEILRGR